MAVSKVELANGEVLVDLTNDSVTPDALAEGATAHDASGARIIGTMKGGGGVSVQADWNQTDETAADFIKNKPIVIEGVDTLTWDGDMAGREYVEIDGVFLVHVSDATPTVSDLANGSTFSVFFCEAGQSITKAITGEDIIEGTGAMALGTYIAIAAAAGAELDGLVFPKKGVYFLCAPTEFYISGITINGYTGFVGKAHIDPEYLPPITRDRLPGSTILYIGANNYLFATSSTYDTTKRLTKDEFMKLLMLGQPIYLNSDLRGYGIMVKLYTTEDYVSVRFLAGDITYICYTAEYTPE